MDLPRVSVRSRGLPTYEPPLVGTLNATLYEATEVLVMTVRLSHRANYRLVLQPIPF